MICECCWELFHKEVPATHWMDWGEWLCDEHAEQALSEDDSQEDHKAIPRGTP